MYNSWSFEVNWYNYGADVHMTKKIVVDSDMILEIALDRIGDSLDLSDFTFIDVKQES